MKNRKNVNFYAKIEFVLVVVVVVVAVAQADVNALKSI